MQNSYCYYVVILGIVAVIVILLLVNRCSRMRCDCTTWCYHEPSWRYSFCIYCC